MTELAPYLTALLSGLVLPGLFILARWQKSMAEKRGTAIEARLVEEAEKVARKASEVAIDVANAAVEAGALAEGRLSVLLDRNNADVRLAISRLDGINGKVAAVIGQQAQDHDHIVWLLGKANEPLARKDTP